MSVKLWSLLLLASVVSAPTLLSAETLDSSNMSQKAASSQKQSNYKPAFFADLYYTPASQDMLCGRSFVKKVVFREKELKRLAATVGDLALDGFSRKTDFDRGLHGHLRGEIDFASPRSAKKRETFTAAKIMSELVAKFGRLQTFDKDRDNDPVVDDFISTFLPIEIGALITREIGGQNHSSLKCLSSRRYNEKKFWNPFVVAYFTQRVGEKEQFQAVGLGMFIIEHARRINALGDYGGFLAMSRDEKDIESYIARANSIARGLAEIADGGAGAGPYGVPQYLSELTAALKTVDGSKYPNLPTAIEAARQSCLREAPEARRVEFCKCAIIAVAGTSATAGDFIAMAEKGFMTWLSKYAVARNEPKAITFCFK